MLIDLCPEECAVVLDEVAGGALSKARIVQPPVDAFAVARVLGITVATDAGQQGRARYVRLRGLRGNRPQPTVLLKPEERPERSHFALAHEIGEHLAHRVFDSLGVDPVEAPGGMRETVANQLAGRLLVPTEWFRTDAVACDWDLPQLKARFATASHELLARRMVDQPPPVIVTIVDQGQKYLRLSNIPGRTPPLTEIETACRRQAHEENRAAEAEAFPLRIQAWPIHEPGWQREIVRTEVELFA